LGELGDEALAAAADPNRCAVALTVDELLRRAEGFSFAAEPETGVAAPESSLGEVGGDATC
jgi:hypothetical protein